jgi:hypothetical protein
MEDKNAPQTLAASLENQQKSEEKSPPVASKTNWKFLLIVTVLVVIAGGMILWFTSKKESSSIELPKESPVISARHWSSSTIAPKFKSSEFDTLVYGNGQVFAKDISNGKIIQIKQCQSISLAEVKKAVEYFDSPFLSGLSDKVAMIGIGGSSDYELTVNTSSGLRTMAKSSNFSRSSEFDDYYNRIVYWCSFEKIEASVGDFPESNPPKEVAPETPANDDKTTQNGNSEMINFGNPDDLVSDFNTVGKDKETGWSIGRSNANKFEIEYPEDFHIHFRFGEITISSELEIFPQSTGPHEKATIDIYRFINKKNYSLDYLLFHHIDFLGGEKITIGEEAVRRIDEDFPGVFTYFVHDGYIYILRGTSGTKEYFNQYRELIEKIEDTFRFI